MARMRISLPDGLQRFVDSRAAAEGHRTGASYISELIRRERDRLKLRDLMRDGAASPLEGPADEAHFEKLHRRLTERPGR